MNCAKPCFLNLTLPNLILCLCVWLSLLPENAYAAKIFRLGDHVRTKFEHNELTMKNFVGLKLENGAQKHMPVSRTGALCIKPFATWQTCWGWQTTYLLEVGAHKTFLQCIWQILWFAGVKCSRMFQLVDNLVLPAKQKAKSVNIRVHKTCKLPWDCFQMANMTVCQCKIRST